MTVNIYIYIYSNHVYKRLGCRRAAKVRANFYKKKKLYRIEFFKNYVHNPTRTLLFFIEQSFGPDPVFQ